MERLTKKMKDQDGKGKFVAKAEFLSNPSEYTRKIINRLGEYEDMDAIGLIPHCNIGDTAYMIRAYKGVKQVQQGIISEMYYTKYMELLIAVKHIGRGRLGEKVFLTLDEAEQALKKMKEEG